MLATLRFFHIIFMAAWFGSVLFVAGDARRSLAAPDMSRELLAGRLRRAGRVSTVSGILTILTGFVMIFGLGGFGNVPYPIHISILTALGMLGVGVGLIGGQCEKIIAGLETGQAPDTLTPHVRKVAMGVGIFHSLWIISLVLMVFRAFF